MPTKPLAECQVRAARACDADQIFELVKVFATSFRPERGAFDASYERLVTAQDARLMVIDADGKLLGYLLGFDHDAFFANGRVAWVEEIVVESGWRRHGLGRRLMDEFERWASDRGCLLVALATRRAASFYKSLGYDESATYFRKLIE